MGTRIGFARRRSRPTGARVLTGSDDETARLWDAASGKEVRRFEGHADWVWSVAFSPDGRSVLTGSDDKTARLWDASSGKEVRRFEGHTDNVVSVVFSPDGRSVLTGSSDRTARLWDASSGKEVCRFDGHTHAVRAAAFSPDGRYVLTGSTDGTTRLWSPATGAELCALISFRDGTWAVVGPDGRFDTTSLERVEGLHWVMPDDPMTPVAIEIFMRDYYEPRLLPRLLAGEKMAPVPPLVGLNRVQPVVKVASIEAAGEDEVSVTVEVESAERAYGGKTWKSGAQDLQLFRDGRLVGYRDGPLALDSGKAVVAFRGVRLPRDGRKEVEFSAYAFNTDRVKSETHRVVHALPPLEPRKGVAYLVCLGADVFADPKWDLGYAVADARAVAESLRNRLSGYERVVPVLLTSTKDDDHARKGDLETVLRLLAGRSVTDDARQRVPGAEGLQRARPEDLVVISVSTHGATDAKGQFHLVPSDVAKGDGWLASCISADDLTDWLRDVDAGEMAMIVDACHSAASVDAEGFKPGPMGSRGLGQLAYSKRMRVLAASQASDVALESRVIRHGLLTYALVTDGLEKGRADFDPADGKITLAEWFRYGEKRVPSLAEEVAEGKVRAVGERGLDIDRKRHVAQLPSLFDFARERDEVVELAVRWTVRGVSRTRGPGRRGGRGPLRGSNAADGVLRTRCYADHRPDKEGD